MATKLHILCLSVFLLALVLLPRHAGAQDDRLASLTHHITARRAAAGLVTLRPHPMLMQSAERYAKVMADHGVMSHSADGTQPGDRILQTGYSATRWAERIAWMPEGYSDMAFITDMWINDPAANAKGPLILNTWGLDYGLAMYGAGVDGTYVVWLAGTSVQPAKVYAPVVTKPAKAVTKPVTKKPVRIKPATKP